MNTTVENYLINGCMRCPLGGTTDCKVHEWREELKTLRKIILETGLEEEVKWGVPCYTFRKSNVLILSALKDHCSLGFFKGALLGDEHGVLVQPGENSQAVRQFRFTEMKKIVELAPVIKAYVFEAIEAEKAGLKVTYKKNPEPIPEELQQKLNEDPFFKTAFEALTPGRQRGYILYFSQPKQSQTRLNRIEKYSEKILNGEGMHDKYKSMKRK